MNIVIQQNRKKAFREFTGLEIHVPSLSQTFLLDLDFSAILKMSWRIDAKALDFLVLSAVVFAVDKIALRRRTPDRWTRDLRVTLPLQHFAEWNQAAAAFAESVSFLTGDRWHFTFTQADGPFSRRRTNRRKLPRGFPKTPEVSLLSGGLDSFVGALDLCAKFPKQPILFVSHYDGDVAGPASDQAHLCECLKAGVPNPISHLQVRVGVRRPSGNSSNHGREHAFETSFRSRSLIFLGLAVYAASKVGARTPIHIPENGPIALNMPLNPSRRGSCSTRTVHPYFIDSLQKALVAAGIRHEITNPYELKTKGEMLSECLNQHLLKSAYQLTNSCGKAGRRAHWNNRRARACGACVPCLFRRASLHAIGCDDEVYGFDVLALRADEHPDFHALIGLLRRKPSRKDIAKALLANGRLPLAKLDLYAGVVERMLGEVGRWLSAKASSSVCALAGIKKSP
ncbi:MAG: hypothetical protein JXR37_08715 [Kiritimatiellae bacterium]|nr:hypothetical protein [Kiritimatiellia bacterium]